MHSYLVHLRQINDDSVVTRRVAGHTVPPTSNGEWKTRFASELDAFDDVSNSGAPDNCSWILVDEAIPDSPGALEPRMPGKDDLAMDSRLELSYGLRPTAVL